MNKNEILLSKLATIKSKFNTNEQEILQDFFIKESIRNLFNEKPINKNKIDLFYMLKSLDESIFENKKGDLMRHKAIQTRALILDLISTDYSVDVKYIYKPEKWIYKIIEDIKYSLIKNSELVVLYNKFLIKEFEDIFINNVEKYGSNGNQLLVNFIFYKNFMSKYLKYDFKNFINNIKRQIDPIKIYKDAELESIVKESE